MPRPSQITIEDLNDLSPEELDALDQGRPTVFVKKYCDRRRISLAVFHTHARAFYDELRAALGYQEVT